MPITYEPIATNTLGSATATVTFSTISGSYTDLILVISAFTGDDLAAYTIRLNGDTGSNYSVTSLEGQGTSAVSQQQSNQTQMYITGVQRLTLLAHIVVYFAVLAQLLALQYLVCRLLLVRIQPSPSTA
jgi:hypothetical protein